MVSFVVVVVVVGGVGVLGRSRGREERERVLRRLCAQCGA